MDKYGDLYIIKGTQRLNRNNAVMIAKVLGIKIPKKEQVDYETLEKLLIDSGLSNTEYDLLYSGSGRDMLRRIKANE